MTRHVHAESMRLYAEDAAETDKHWEGWEVLHSEPESSWQVCDRHPLWVESNSYRRKPKTIRIGEFDVPEPCREPLTRGRVYYVPDLFNLAGRGWQWNNDSLDNSTLARGLVHLTAEAAVLHAQALVSFTKAAS